MLINHISTNWSEKQLAAAREAYGEITDFPFPPVAASAPAEQIHSLADEIVGKVITLQPTAVLCQGEFTLTYAIVSCLKERGITVVAACSERNVRENILSDGRTEKTVSFDFVQFREY